MSAEAAAAAAVAVGGKMGAFLECVQRPLRPHETPKRRGQTTVFEATGHLSADGTKVWDQVAQGTVSVRATIKHDGQCGRVIVDRSTTPPTVALYRRLDVKEGKKPPSNAVQLPSAENIFHNADGHHNIYWIRVDGSGRADNQYFESTLRRDPKTDQIVALAVISPKGQGHVFIDLPIDELPDDSTVELVGPKVQGDPYGIAKTPHSASVTLPVENKMRAVPQHWLIFHGAFDITLSKSWWNPRPNLEVVRDFILEHKLEGIVLQFRNDKGELVSMLKVNRGHIGVPHDGSSALRISEAGEVSA